MVDMDQIHLGVAWRICDPHSGDVSNGEITPLMWLPGLPPSDGLTPL
jgi:hypothetical protein